MPVLQGALRLVAGRCCGVLVCAVAFAASNLAAQERSTPKSAADSVQLVPGPQYRTNLFHRWLLGGNYRDLWTRPITVTPLDLAPWPGGLPAASASGVEARGAPLADLLREQAASRPPAGGLVVAPLLEATGVLHLRPRLGIVPGPATSAGMLGTIEVQPGAGFAGSDRVEGTEQVWALIEASPADRVDAPTYLKARLMDVLVGDADRGPARWSWAGYGAGGGRVWRAVPRGHESAFARLDGMVLSVARRFLPQLVSFGPDYPDLYGLTWSAQGLDRRLLVELDKPQWDSVARFVMGQLTDSLLALAVARLPREIHQRTGAALLDALKSRRDGLLDAVDRFYPLVNEYADVFATDRDEWAEVERLGRQVRVRIGLGDGPGAPYFERTFALEETKEIRVYLAGGNDRVIVRGSAPRSVRVRVVGGSGTDVMVDSSVVGLPLVRGILPVTSFYDDDGDSRLVPGPGTEVHRGTFRAPASFRDWGSSWVPTPWIAFQPSLGLLIGAGAERRGYAFRKTPYGSRQLLRGAVATGPGRFRVEYEGDFRDLPLGAWASLGFRYSGIDFLQFYGMGNETVNAAPPAYYRATQRRVGATASLTVFPGKSRVSAGPFFAFAETDTGRGGLIDSLRPYGAERFVEVGGDVRADLDTRDRASAPRRGVRVLVNGRWVPKGLDVVQWYGSVSGAVSSYVSLGDPARVTLATRAGGKKVFGRYPFHAAAFLGGANTLRGYDEQRFAGDASLYGNAELRLFLTRMSVPVPADVGILGLGDVGRVFVVGERSGQWHRAVGGGLWLAFLERGSTVTLTVARSPERWAIYGGLGFMF